MIAPLSQIALFAVLVAAAVASVRRPATHRRLMLLATANLLPPAAGLFSLVLGPLARPDAGRGSIAVVSDVNLAFSVTLAAALVADLLIVMAIVYDWRTRGRPHRAYVIGVACMLLVQLLRKPFAYTDLWALDHRRPARPGAVRERPSETTRWTPAERPRAELGS